MELSNVERQVLALNAQRPRFIRLALGLLRTDKSSAEDAVQNALLRVLCTRAPFRGKSTLGTWFHRVVVRECLQMHRTGAERIISTALPLEVLYREPTDGLLSMYEKKELVALALRCCTREQASILRLRYLGGLDGKELMRVTGLSAPAMKSRVHRAREKARRAITRVGGL